MLLLVLCLPLFQAVNLPVASSATEPAAVAPYAQTPTVRIRYQQHDEPAESEHVVKVLYLGNGRKGVAQWHWFDAKRCQQAQCPAGQEHPKVTRVLAAMRPVPVGQRVHPDRDGLATGTKFGALFGCDEYADRDAKTYGLKDGAALVVARAKGLVPPVESNWHMKRGEREESEALDLFEKLTKLELVRSQKMGLLVHPANTVGASPDGLCRRLPLFVEIKSKYRATTVEMPEPHFYQTQCQMLATVPPGGGGVPLIKYVAYFQYVSRAASGFPLCSLRMVKFDAALTDAMLLRAAGFVKAIRGGGGGEPTSADGDGDDDPEWTDEERKEDKPAGGKRDHSRASGVKRGHQKTPPTKKKTSQPLPPKPATRKRSRGVFWSGSRKCGAGVRKIRKV